MFRDYLLERWTADAVAKERTMFEKRIADAVAKERTMFEKRTADAVAKTETKAKAEMVLHALRTKSNVSRRTSKQQSFPCLTR